MNNKLNPFIGFRDKVSGRLAGPYINENQLSALISLLPVSSPSPVQYGARLENGKYPTLSLFFVQTAID